MQPIPKKGRPYSGDKLRDKTLRVRMEPAEVEELDTLADEMNTTRSGVVRKGIELVKRELGKEK